MSVVAVKKKENGKFEIAADDICVHGWTVSSNADNRTFSKIREVNGSVIGATGLAADASLIFMYAKVHLIKSIDEDGMLEWFKGFLDWKKEKTDCYGLQQTTFIIVNSGRAFYFENFLCSEIKDNFAIGAGMDFALAALKLGHSVKESVEVACDLSAFCSLPVHVMEA